MQTSLTHVSAQVQRLYVQTDGSERTTCTRCSELVTECEQLRDQVKWLQAKNLKLKGQLNEEKVAKMSEEKVAYYTRLSKATFLVVLAAIVAALPAPRRGLPYRSQMLLFLMCLRLGLSIKDIAYRFHVSPNTAGRIFRTWLPPMTSLCGELVVFPEPDVARSWLTSNERLNFPNFRGIIDCSEVPLSWPYNLSTQQEV